MENLVADSAGLSGFRKVIQDKVEKRKAHSKKIEERLAKPKSKYGKPCWEYTLMLPLPTAKVSFRWGSRGGAHKWLKHAKVVYGRSTTVAMWSNCEAERVRVVGQIHVHFDHPN